MRQVSEQTSKRERRKEATEGDETRKREEKEGLKEGIKERNNE